MIRADGKDGILGVDNKTDALGAHSKDMILGMHEKSARAFHLIKVPCLVQMSKIMVIL